ncbi:MAG: transposase [Selenomonadaceae bacterium]|nr:transposase [Selenomonadaceae bacterium]
MDITALEKTYQRIDRNLASPRQMWAIIVYAGMNHIFSSQHLASCIKKLFAQMDFMLEGMGAISLQDIFIDGTKIESAANKYKFVWKKSVQKNQAKLLEKLPDFVNKAKEDFSVSLSYGNVIHLHQLKKLRRKLKARQKEQGIQFVHGIGKRSSFAKTDLDATFMRMKEDAMKNGQLKPAYNIQYGTDSEFVTWATVGPQPADTTTLIPFLQEMERYTNKRYRNVVADAGYESEENYRIQLRVNRSIQASKISSS